MKFRSLILLCALLGASWFSYAADVSPTIETKVYPAVYKGKSGPTQRVWVTINHSGKPASATLRLENQTQKVKLADGKNRFYFDVPVVQAPTKMHFAVSGAHSFSQDIMVEPARHWQMNMVQHTHTDIGYTRSQMEILAEHLRYIDYALDYCDATDDYPDAAKFRWTCEISWAVSEYLKCRPAEQIARLKQRVKEGRIELAAMYLNFDELPDEQTLASSLYPIKQFREEGLKTELAMQDDVNGIGWCFSEYFADAGVKYLNMGTHGHRALICFDKPTVFWWESPSGKKMLAYRAEHYNQGNFFGIHTDDFEQFEERVLTYLGELEAKNYPYDICAAQHSGYFTDNAPPSTKSCEMVKRWNEKYEWPKLRTAVATEFIKTVEKEYPDKIETIRGAWPDWWTDGFASGAREAAISRVTHSNIIANQAGLGFAKMLGARLPEGINEDIDGINNALLFYDEHTFGHSESVRNPYGLETWEQRSLKQSYAWEAYRYTGLLGETTMGLLQSFVPKANRPSIAVFNTLNWTYSGIAKMYIDHELLPKEKAFRIVDISGNVIPAQPGESRSDGTYWYLYCKDVPALGYAQYFIEVSDNPRLEKLYATTLEHTQVENQWYKIDFNPAKGTIRQLFDKDLKQNLLTENAEWEMGEFIYEIIDSRHPMEQYKAPQFLRRRPEKMRFERFEKGDIWDTYRFRGETVAGREPNNLMVEFRVYNVEKKIEVVYRLRKKAVTDPEAVYIAFPYEVENGKIHLDVPGGNIEAGVDQIKGSSNDWYTVQNFATARNGNSQVVMGSQEIPLMQFGAINTGRYKAGAVPQTTNMYSWPMNNYWVTNFNADQMGELQWSYFITSSEDNSTAFATQFAWENRIPFLTRVLQANEDSKEQLAPASILKIVPENLLLVNMRPVEGENAVMLQLREINGKPATFAATSDKIAIRQIQECDVVGDPIANASLDFAPWENKFIKISW